MRVLLSENSFIRTVMYPIIADTGDFTAIRIIANIE